MTPHPSSLTPHVSVRLRRFLPLVCSCAALILAFVGLFEWDVPLTRFIRSLNDVHMTISPIPGWLSSAISATVWAKESLWSS